MQFILDRDIHQILSEAQNKKIILYGAGNYARDVIEKLNCLDIEVNYCVDDSFENVMVKKPVKDIYSLLLEKGDFFIYIAKQDVQACARILEGMGFRHLKDYNSIYNAAGRIKPENTYALDPVFGYSMPWEQTDGTGVKILGEMEKRGVYKVVILGNSTSDPCEYEWKSWGELLYEKCNQEEKNVCIIIGAISGYSSGEEFFKLIRDILPLNPDLVISYSGVLDRVTVTPYINGYQSLLYKKLTALRPKGVYGLGIPEKVCYGWQQKELVPANNWIRNQQGMYAITKEFHIRYLSFVQPNLVTKKRLPGGKDEETLFYVNERIVREREAFQEGLKGQLANKAYIVDATHWFDETDGLFYDYCHVIEEGNQLIADKVYDLIF